MRKKMSRTLLPLFSPEGGVMDFNWRRCAYLCANRQDIHARVGGNAALDVLAAFVERWAKQAGHFKYAEGIRFRFKGSLHHARQEQQAVAQLQ